MARNHGRDGCQQGVCPTGVLWLAQKHVNVSEGGALVRRAIARLFELYDGPLRSERPEPWYPYVFTSPQDAIAAGLANDSRAAVRAMLNKPDPI
jgi:hypothetical protein